MAAGPTEEIFVSFLQEGNETSKQRKLVRISFSGFFLFFSNRLFLFRPHFLSSVFVAFLLFSAAVAQKSGNVDDCSFDCLAYRSEICRRISAQTK